MAVRTKIDGREYEADTPAELAALVREMAPSPVAEPHPPSPSKSPSPKRVRKRQRTRGDNYLESVTKMLRTIQGAGKGGIPATELSEALGFSDARGLGPVAAAAKRRIQETGRTTISVYEPVRRNNIRYWCPGSKIGEMIADLERNGSSS